MKCFPGQTEAQTELLSRFGRSMLWLGLVYSIPMVQWVLFACRSDLHSHVLLVPFVSAYLIRICALDGLWEPERNLRGTTAWARIWTVLAIGAAAGYLTSAYRGLPLPRGDSIALGALSLLFAFYALACRNFSERSLRQITFPLAFLLFFVPLPGVAMDAIEVFLQHASAEVASWFFNLSGLPFLRDQLTFALPGITIRVAQECSGVRSSLVLFMTSLIAGYLFLRNSKHRLFLALFTVILGIIRNAFRILVIAWLCVQIGPEMIHSVIHKRGGPLFFVLSLLPLDLVLWLMLRRERKGSAPPSGSRLTPGPLVAGGRGAANQA